MSSVNALPPLGATLALGKRVFAFASDVFARKTFGVRENTFTERKRCLLTQHRVYRGNTDPAKAKTR